MDFNQKEESLQLLPNSVRKLKISKPGERRFFVGSFVLFFLVVLVWGGVLVYGQNLKSKALDLNTQIDLKLSEVSRGNRDAVLDTLGQLSSIKQILSSHVKLSAGLEKIQNMTLFSVSVKTLKYEGASKEAKIGIEANTYMDAAKQFAAYEGAGFVKDVSTSGVKRAPNGLIDIVYTVIFIPEEFFK